MSWNCTCGEENSENDLICECRQEKPIKTEKVQRTSVTTPDTTESTPATDKFYAYVSLIKSLIVGVTTPDTKESTPATKFLRLFAYVSLIGSVIVAFFIFSKYGTTGQYISRANPIGIIAGIATIIQGIFAFSVILVFTNLADNIREINNKI